MYLVQIDFVIIAHSLNGSQDTDSSIEIFMYYNLKYCISQMIYQGFYILTLKNMYVVISLLLFNLLGVWRYIHCFDQLIHSGRQKFFRLQNWTSFCNICQFPSRQPCFTKQKFRCLSTTLKPVGLLNILLLYLPVSF